MSLLNSLKANANLPPEVEQGNIEYKVKLLSPTPERMQHLITQLKWRLSEGGGEAIYELGVSDGGTLIGMTEHELSESMATLRRMAAALDAQIGNVRVRKVPGLARRRSDLDREDREQRKQMRYQQHQALSVLSSLDQLAAGGTESEDCRLSSDRHRRQSENVLGIGLRWFDDDVESKTASEDSTDGDDRDDVSPVPPGAHHAHSDTFSVAEVTIHKTVELPKHIDVRLAFIGSSDAGKSTLLGYLVHGELDNGRGKARLNLLKSRHEVESGRSSTISSSVIGFDQNGTLLNQNSPSISTLPSFNPAPTVSIATTPTTAAATAAATSDTEDEHETMTRLMERSSKILTLIDMPGHRNYFRNALVGLTGYNPDYACLVVDCQMGSMDQTMRELVGFSRALSGPCFIVLTKIDLASASEDGKEKLRTTLQSLIRLLAGPPPSSSRPSSSTSTTTSITNTSDWNSNPKWMTPVIIQTEVDAVQSVDKFVQNSVLPFFLVSAVTGENLGLLVKFLSLLPPRSMGAAVS